MKCNEIMTICCFKRKIECQFCFGNDFVFEIDMPIEWWILTYLNLMIGLNIFNNQKEINDK